MVIIGVDEESGDAHGYFSVRDDDDDYVGYLLADGVRLRSEPSLSSSSKILELMYINEMVTIHGFLQNSDGDWYYITRDKTDTKGYVYTKYIMPVGAC